MSKFQNSDMPINEPEDDLLGMKAYASLLASRIMNIENSFTIGIYGEWGSGKTSFVNLIRDFLIKENSSVKFISFSAWPYTTVDTLWRALIMEIARELYNITDDKEDEEGPVEEQKDFLTWISNCVTARNLVLWSPPALPPQNEKDRSLLEYKQFIASFEQTSYASISKDATKHYQINQDVAMMAIINAAMDALGTISPLMSTLRRFFGLKSEYSLSSFLRKTKNKVVSDRADSVDESRIFFSKTLNTKVAKCKKVVVFIDDLDRCLPDVALDALEAIKIFFREVDCIFIVAADESLIGQALRLRYKDLLAFDGSQTAQKFFIRKGREYFEKIIQFGINVPPQTPKQIRDFITLQFPKWTLTTDILETVIGSNPRRLKQQCRLLSYRYDVGLGQEQISTSGFYEQFPLLEKMIALYNLYIQTSGHTAIRQLLQNTKEYYKTMQQLEKTFVNGTEGAVDCDIFSGDGKILCEIATKSSVLGIVFSQWNVAFSNTSLDNEMLEQLEVLKRLVDLSPSLQPTQTIFDAQDKVFLRVLKAVSETRSILASELVRDAVTKLTAINKLCPDAAKILIQLASSPRWTEQMLAIEIKLDPSSGKKAKLVELNPISRKIVSIIENIKPRELKVEQEKVSPQGMSISLRRDLVRILLNHDAFRGDAELRSIFISSSLYPLRGELPEASSKRERVELVVDFLYSRYNAEGENALLMFLQSLADSTYHKDIIYQDLLNLISEFEVVLSPPVEVAISDGDKKLTLQQLFLRPPRLSTLLRNEVLGILNKQRAELKLAGRLLQQYIISARYILRLRKFAKLYALDAKWPELGHKLRDNLIILERLESLALRSISTSRVVESTLKLWEKYKDDPLFIEFLNLRPLFANFYPDEFSDYFMVSQQVEPKLFEEITVSQRETIFDQRALR